MTMALHGKRIQKRRPLSKEERDRKAKIRLVGACLPCKLDGKAVSKVPTAVLIIPIMILCL